MAPKRKRASAHALEAEPSGPIPALPTSLGNSIQDVPQKRPSKRVKAATNPDTNSQVIDGADASRASPDNVPNAAVAPGLNSDSSLSDVPELDAEPPKKQDRGAKAKPQKVKAESPGPTSPVALAKSTKPSDEAALGDPEADGDEEANEEEIKEALSRPPPVNSDYLPLPWKGRLGYVGADIQSLVARLT